MTKSNSKHPQLPMNDREFLLWIHDRLFFIHGEDPSTDYMHKLLAIANAIPPDRITPNVPALPEQNHADVRPAGIQ